MPAALQLLLTHQDYLKVSAHTGRWSKRALAMLLAVPKPQHRLNVHGIHVMTYDVVPVMLQVGFQLRDVVVEKMYIDYGTPARSLGWVGLDCLICYQQVL